MVLVELVWTALVFGWLLLFHDPDGATLGDTSSRVAWLGVVAFVFWVMTQAVMFPMALVSLVYLAIDWLSGGTPDDAPRAQ